MRKSETVESTAQSVCAQCGSRLTPSGDGEKLCTHCLLQVALNQDDVDPDQALRRFDHSIPSDNGTPIEFGDYELLQEIGRGSQGVVYRARQKSLNRTVALKIIACGHWASQPHLKRFRREAEAAASLNHPGIVPIYEVGEHDGACYFSMRFVEGGQLDAIASQEPMSLRRAAELIAKLARIVHYAHEHGILHRDIKPGNILLDATGEPHLSDFGLARLVETESTVTQTRAVMGTPSYMAPEQAVGDNAAISSATDVYGLGAVLYQLLTGHPPFAGGTSYETIKLLLDTEPRQPRLWSRKIDRDLSTICLKCLEKDPKRRYSTARALAEDLERWLKREPIQARRTGIFVRGKKWVRRNPTMAIAAVLLVGLVAAVGVIISKSEWLHPAPKAGIAVLPFENLSENKADAYFAEAIQDEILTRLSKISDLKVIARTSVQRYQSKPDNLPAIGKQLGVAYILEGSVQKRTDASRVNVQLIKAATSSHVWADTFDRKLTDIFAVETEIAKTVADTLQAKLTGSEERAIAAKPTENPEAHELYLKGRFFWNKRTNSDLKTAIQYFDRAIEKDPSYALAYAGLADAYALLTGYGATPVSESFPRAEAAAKKALELDESLAEAHTPLGLLLFYKLDFQGATKEFERAITLNPNYATAHHWYGLGPLRCVGDHDKAIAELKRALQLDPLSLIINADLGVGLVTARRYDKAIAQLRKTIEMDPYFYYAHFNLGKALQLNGQLDEAVTEYKKAAALNDDPLVLGLLAQAYAKLGQRDQALKTLEQLQQTATRRYVWNYTFALVHIALGENNQAIDFLERDYREHADYEVALIKVDPMLDPLRGDPRFEALVAKVFAPKGN
jgi:serine/threonine protein kinase/Tfp pilus assembly protein PilF